MRWRRIVNGCGQGCRRCDQFLIVTTAAMWTARYSKLEELVDRRRVVEDIDGPSARVGHLDARIDAEDVVQRRVYVGRRDRARVRARAEAIGGANDLSAADAAA